jgi:hypothetical protein
VVTLLLLALLLLAVVWVHSSVRGTVDKLTVSSSASSSDSGSSRTSGESLLEATELLRVAFPVARETITQCMMLWCAAYTLIACRRLRVLRYLLLLFASTVSCVCSALLECVVGNTDEQRI